MKKVITMFFLISFSIIRLCSPRSMSKYHIKNIRYWLRQQSKNYITNILVDSSLKSEWLISKAIEQFSFSVVSDSMNELLTFNEFICNSRRTN
ncbi:MAG: hypothetical protein LLG13_05840 [Bacteroidales bacterium]|nr:hypothetical protein [Bacteroidales bacterium]